MTDATYRVHAMKPHPMDEAMWASQNKYTLYANDTASLVRALSTETMPDDITYRSLLIEDVHITDMTLDFYELDNIMLRNVTFERCVLYSLGLLHGANYGITFRDTCMNRSKINSFVNDCSIDTCVMYETNLSHCEITQLQVRNSQLQVFSNFAVLNTLTLDNSCINANVSQLTVDTLNIQATALDQLRCCRSQINTLERIAPTLALSNSINAAYMDDIIIVHDDTRKIQ